jgi:hypothetical protein
MRCFRCLRLLHNWNLPRRGDVVGGLLLLLLLPLPLPLLFLLLWWHPRDVIGLHALPLCGAAPTFLCRRKEK